MSVQCALRRRFLQPYADFPARCPDCGKVQVWPADEAEVANYINVRAEIAAEAAD